MRSFPFGKLGRGLLYVSFLIRCEMDNELLRQGPEGGSKVTGVRGETTGSEVKGSRESIRYFNSHSCFSEINPPNLSISLNDL